MVWIILLLPTLLLQDTQPWRMERAYQFALTLMHRGHLGEAQRAAHDGYLISRGSDELWTARFQVQEAILIFRRGHTQEALALFSQAHPVAWDTETRVRALSSEALARTYLGEYVEAQKLFHAANALCSSHYIKPCGYLSMNQGMNQGMLRNFRSAQSVFQNLLTYAQQAGDPFLEESAAINLGWIYSLQGDMSAAQKWDRQALQIAQKSGDRDAQLSVFSLLVNANQLMGDPEGMRDRLQQAEAEAEALGCDSTASTLLFELAETDLSQWRMNEAEGDFRKLADRYRAGGNRTNLLYYLFTLTDILVGEKKAEEAERVVAECHSLVSPNDRYGLQQLAVFEARVHLLEGRYGEVEALLRPVLASRDATSQQIFAAHTLGETLALEGKSEQAEAIYRDAVKTFQANLAGSGSFASQLRLKVDAALFFSGAIRFYVRQGKGEEALRLADLFYGSSWDDPAAHKPAFDPRAAARRANATLLTYWLGDKASYLWVVTPQSVQTIELPDEHLLKPQLVAYRKAIVESKEDDPAVRAQGRALWQTLIAPARLPRNAQVVLIDDEELSKLNFETLLAPDAGKQDDAQPDQAHYWIEDVTLRTAPSLTALLAAHPAPLNNNRLLLMGNAIPATPEYGALDLAPMEIEMVRKHFAKTDAATVLEHAAATPQAYAHSNPGQYAYLHFVAHGVPSPSDPLDGMIVLSRGSQAEDSYKLYGREILAHPLHARLVTISACSGSGARYFNGQGMVGLGWAFQQAGAQNVVGALWNISDFSTPQLMDKMYTGLQRGLTPADALRQAKLALLHSSTRFQSPFYWAPFQLYTRQ